MNEWRIRGEGPAYTKMGRLIRYPDYEVERYIRERTIETSYRKRPQGEEREVGVPVQAERAARGTHCAHRRLDEREASDQARYHIA